MKAVMFVPRPCGGEVDIREVPLPAPGVGEALVKVHAAGLNRGELMVKRSLVSGAPQQTGIEFAGEVAGLGAGATRFRVGERVMGHWRGGQAEFAAVDERLLVPVPERLTWIEAAGWLNVFVTAHDAIVTNARLTARESIHINAASSGIGVAALQIARLIGAEPVIGSSRSSAKLQQLRHYGMQIGVNAGVGEAAAIAQATGSRGVNVLIDSVGGPALKHNLESMALCGRIVSVGRLAGNTGELNLDLLAQMRVKLVGVTFRTRSKEERIACIQSCEADLWQALADGALQPVVHRSFKMADVKAAHEFMATNQHIGKLVIEII